MVKLAVLFFAALAFQASVAVPRYQEESSLYYYLDRIHSEVRDLTAYFENDFPEHPLAVKNVIWQCNTLVQVLEVIINKLREEQTFAVRGEHQVIYTFEELIGALRKVSAQDVHELKKYFVVTINTVSEHFGKLVAITNAYYPDFRYTLKYLLVDFMSALHGIRSHFAHINAGFQVMQTPRQLIKEIHEYTREITEVVKDFNHPAQIKVALRRYLYYVDEIVRSLQAKDIIGHKELDTVVQNLANKLRDMAFPLRQLMQENSMDIKVFRTKIVTYYYEIVSVLEQLVQLSEDRVLPEQLSSYLMQVIYHYWYAVRHVSYEVKLGYKIGFYTPEYYNADFYSKYGYGLYENDFHQRFYVPHETSVQHSNNYEQELFTPYRYDSLFPGDSQNTNQMYETSYYNRYRPSYNNYAYGSKYYYNHHVPSYYNNGYESNYYNRYGTSYYQRYGPNYYRSNHYNPYSSSYYNKYESNHYNYGFEAQTVGEVVNTIRMLVNNINQQYQYNYYKLNEAAMIRELIQFVDYFLEHIQTTQHYYSDQLQEIRMQLRQAMSTGIYNNNVFINSIEYVAKWLEQYGLETLVSETSLTDSFHIFNRSLTLRKAITDISTRP
ncbi:hypothetical protein FQR65_LT11066 [Abscondita terminalis]|nr:hypothetical protein FQR65_LT11066 [Abscondita terminalis]